MNPGKRVRMPRHTPAEEYLEQRVREAAAYHLADARRSKAAARPERAALATAAWQVFDDAARRAAVAAAEGLVYSETVPIDTMVHALARRLLDSLAWKHAEARARRRRAEREARERAATSADAALTAPTSGVTR